MQSSEPTFGWWMIVYIYMSSNCAAAFNSVYIWILDAHCCRHKQYLWWADCTVTVFAVFFLSTSTYIFIRASECLRLYVRTKWNRLNRQKWTICWTFHVMYWFFPHFDDVTYFNTAITFFFSSSYALWMEKHTAYIQYIAKMTKITWWQKHSKNVLTFDIIIIIIIRFASLLAWNLR